MRSRYFLWLHRDGSDNGGGGPPSKEKGGQSIADRLVARYGSAEAALARLAEENYEYREEKRTLKEQLDQATKKLPADGAIVLTGDDAKAFTAFQALNIPLAKVGDVVKERDAAKAQIAERDREAVVREAATLAGFTKPNVLAELAKTKNLHVEIREIDVEKDGKTEKRKVPHVRPADKTDAPLEALDSFAKRELVDFLPALTAPAEGGSGTTHGSTGTAGSSSGAITPFATQPASGSAPKGDAVDRFLAAQQDRATKASSPLLPAKR